jgi:H+/Cl- antiporter ClcA
MKWPEILTFIATILVAGWFSAFITQALKQQKWPSSLKLILSAVIAGIIALAASWLTGDLLNLVTIYKSGGLTSSELMVYFTGVFTAGATWYKFYMRDVAWAQNLANWPSTVKKIVS